MAKKKYNNPTPIKFDDWEKFLSKTISPNQLELWPLEKEKNPEKNLAPLVSQRGEARK
ncbi:MAG: hypothetical protein [Microvirus sp.]|nr:MAG: hypothetical protein [Microvirus sp.]